METLQEAKRVAHEFVKDLDLFSSNINMPSRKDSNWLLHEWTKNGRYLTHAYTVGAACKGYADYFGEDPELFYQTGLLHDFDNERYPYQEFKTLEEHPLPGIRVLKDFGLPDVSIHAIIAHASKLEIPFTTRLSKVLFAMDELCGFLVALRSVRPGNTLREIEWSSVKKKLNDKKFAAGCDRNNLYRGAELLGFSEVNAFEAHIYRVAEFVERKMVE